MRRDQYLEALYDFGLTKLREVNGDAEDERSVEESRADGADQAVKKRCAGTRARKPVMRMSQTEEREKKEHASNQKQEDDRSYAVGYDAGYEAGLKAGIKATRRPGDLKRGAEECGLLRKQRARLGWSRQGLLGEEQQREREEGNGTGTAGREVRAPWADCRRAECVRMNEQHQAPKNKQRLELALAVKKRKMEIKDAQEGKAARRDLKEQSRHEPRLLFGGGRKSGSEQEGLNGKRSSAGSLTLVGARESVVTEKGGVGGNDAEVEMEETERFWARLRRHCRSLGRVRRSEQRSNVAVVREGSLASSEMGTREAWWSCR